MPYEPMPEHPWPQRESWYIAWWNDDYECWVAATGPMLTKEEALQRLAKRRLGAPDFPMRLLRETSVYTTEED